MENDDKLEEIRKLLGNLTTVDVQQMNNSNSTTLIITYRIKSL